jgi:hypothetical protein
MITTININPVPKTHLSKFITFTKLASSHHWYEVSNTSELPFHCIRNSALKVSVLSE